jgi:hypothetical protein
MNSYGTKLSKDNWFVVDGGGWWVVGGGGVKMSK